MNCICGMYHEDQIKICYFKHKYSAVIGCSVIYNKLIKTVTVEQENFATGNFREFKA